MSGALRLLLFIGSIVVCAIPERYRRWWPIQDNADLRTPALVSGVVECLMGAPGAALYVAAALNVAKGGFGVAGLILNPFLPFLVMFVEGMVRWLAALSSEQVLPTLPLQIVAWIHDSLDARAAERELGTLVIDRIERRDGEPYDLRVSSCRPKPHWNPYMTIRFEDEFYQMFKEEKTSGAQKFIYLLRKNPVGRLVVVVYEYRPDDALSSSTPPERWTPGV